MQCGSKKDISPMKDSTTAQRRHVLYMVAVQLQRGADASARTRAGRCALRRELRVGGAVWVMPSSRLLSDWPDTCTTEVGAVGTLPRHGSTGHSTRTVSDSQGAVVVHRLKLFLISSCLWLSDCCTGFRRNFLALFTGSVRWWSRRLCLSWAGLARGKGHNARESWR